jgi:hypothetical protein
VYFGYLQHHELGEHGPGEEQFGLLEGSINIYTIDTINKIAKIVVTIFKIIFC